MSDYWFAPPQREIVRPYYFQDVERLPQYLSEKVLRARMETLANVEARFGWRALSIEQDEKACASRSPRKAAAGARRSRAIISSVATAGARRCASQIGIDRGGADFDQLMVLAVFRSQGAA